MTTTHEGSGNFTGIDRGAERGLPMMSLFRRIRSRLRSRKCVCGEMRLYGGTVELAGIKHRTDGPCFLCNEYGQPHQTGALPPFSVSYIDPKVCATSTDQWFVMGTVDGDPRNGCGPVAICEYEPSAHTIAALLNRHARDVPPAERRA